MRVLFINPSSAPALNMGLTYVMSAVENEHEIKLLDLGLYGKKYQEPLNQSLKESLEVVAISTVTQNFSKALQVAGFIKQRFPAIKIIFGGIHPTLCPEEVIAHPEIDAICIGEGESALKEYLDSLKNNQEPLVAGIWFKDKKGSLIRNPIRAFEKDIDVLGFPNWDNWDIEYYIKYVDMEKIGFISSRGCPHSCTFCSNAALRKANSGNFFRSRGAEQVIAEIESNFDKYQKFGFKYVRFDDDIFGLDYEFLKKFCSLYISKGLNKKLPWFCQTRADLLTDEYADLIAQAGCAIVGFGVETGDDSTRSRVYKKSISNDSIVAACQRLRKRNIAYIFYLIYDAPYTNRLEIKRTKQLVKQLRPLRANFSPYMYLPKTELADKLDLAARGKKSNHPRLSLAMGSVKNKLQLIICLYYRVHNSLRSGLRLRGFGFILDLIKFAGKWIFGGQEKSFSLVAVERVFFQLEYFTLFKYAISDSRKNIKQQCIK